MAIQKLLTPEEVAEILGVTTQTLSNWRHTQRYPLPYHKLGRSIRYSEEAVKAFIEAQAV